MARIGKIARLPEPVRHELNTRIRAGQLGPQLIPWLNSLPEVQKTLTDYFQSQPITSSNLSDWRLGGYADWEEKQDKTHRIKELAAFALNLTQANGGRIAEGAAAIASGKILELLEAADGAVDPSQLADVVSAVTSLRSAEIAQQRADIAAGSLKQKDQELSLARQKFQRDTCSLFIKWCEDQRAIQAATAPGDNSDKINRLGQLMFGDDWKQEDP